jgi:hypothetical protein
MTQGKGRKDAAHILSSRCLAQILFWQFTDTSNSARAWTFLTKNTEIVGISRVPQEGGMHLVGAVACNEATYAAAIACHLQNILITLRRQHGATA